MNYIKHLTGFFEKVADQPELNPTHISLYVALFQFWNCNRFRNPISISRDEIMRISKISSKATYHKCLKNLHNLGYIDYRPSYNPFKGSHVFMFNFSSQQVSDTTPLFFERVDKQVVHKHKPKSETSAGQALVSYTNSINNRNILNSESRERQDNNSPKSFLDIHKEIESRLKHKNSTHSQDYLMHPSIEDIEEYFDESGYAMKEAKKFFNYFSSIGWLVGGKTPIKNWKATANNWMINATDFKEKHKTKTAATVLPVKNNYEEPL